MKKVRLGRTNLQVTKTAFGALPIQRVEMETAARILRKAFDSGINFIDTARAYSDSEEKIGYALADVRDQLIIATKTTSRERDGVLRDLETSLKTLKTDWLDIVQLHNPPVCPDPDDSNSSYAALAEAKAQGLIRHIGITNHRIEPAREAVTSGLYDTLQFPLSYLSSQAEMDMIETCRRHDVGFIAMKAMSGGLITQARAAFAFMEQYPQVVPIWGIQRESELDEWIALDQDPPELDQELQAVIEQDRQALQGDFCRGCGYCLPCPQHIEIPMAARMSLLLERAPAGPFLEAEWQEKMENIDTCIECGQCKTRCPYELDIPNLLKRQLEHYRKVVR